MPEAAENTVIQIADHRQSASVRSEIVAAQNMLKMMSWDMQVTQVLKLCDLAPTQSILAEGATTKEGSIAASAGHKTIQALVTMPEADGGLGMDWNNFHEKASAQVALTRYQLPSNLTYQEINNQVADCASVLGRLPETAAEFNMTVQKILKGRISEQDREHAASRAESDARVRGLMRELADETQKVVTMGTELKQVRDECTNRIQTMTHEMALRMESQESETSRKIQAVRAEQDACIANAVAAVRVELLRQVESAKGETASARAEVEALKGRIASGELVDATKLKDAEARVVSLQTVEQSLRDQIGVLNLQLDRSKMTEQELREANTHLESQLDNSRREMASMEAKVAELMEKRLNASDFVVLQERLNIAKAASEAYHAEALELRGQVAEHAHLTKEMQMKISMSAGRYKELKGQMETAIKNLKQDVERLQGDLVSETRYQAQMKVALAVMSGLSVIAAAIGAWATYA